LRLIVIHGWGGTFSGAIRTLHRLLDFPCRRAGGAYFVERRTASVLRELLTVPDPDPCLRAFQHLAVSRLLAAGIENRSNDPPSADEAVLLREQRLQADFGHLGLPAMPASRARRARQLRSEAYAFLHGILVQLAELRPRLAPAEGPVPTEAEARKLVWQSCSAAAAPHDLLHLLETVRDMHETGGDLDTVASAVLYAHGLREAARRRGEAFAYGVDYRFVFLNYHESLRSLARFGPAELYMADLPIGAFPAFAGDARFLLERGVTIRRFEDHHPCTTAQIDMLHALQREGALDRLSMSGPLDGNDTGPRQCAADMVFDSTVRGSTADVPGARRLRDAAHAEDYVERRSEFSRLLTGLIKGGICKTELAQLLLDSIHTDDAMGSIREQGWDEVLALWQEAYREQEDALLENTHILQLAHSRRSAAEAGGETLGIGSDVVDRREPAEAAAPRVVVALAPRRVPGKPRITTGRAVEFYAETFEDADYLFYCFGASLMVARRLNQADYAIDLGALMPRIGAASDGGHAGAAVCRPDSSPHFPHRMMQHVNASNFPLFVRYLSLRLLDAGFPVRGREDRSLPSIRRGFRRRSAGLLMVTAAAVVVGAFLAFFHRTFRPERILNSNATFFADIAAESAPAADEVEP